MQSEINDCIIVNETNFKYNYHMRNETSLVGLCNNYQIENRVNLCCYQVFESKKLRNAMNKLPDDCRMLYSMYVSGFKYTEIAKKMNMPLEIVKSRIFFTRQQLQMVIRSIR